MNTLFIFSWTHLWSMKKGAGAPSYHHTISYFINSPNWDVFLFTADKTNLDLTIFEQGKVFLYEAPSRIEKGISKKKVSLVYKHLKHRSYTKWAVSEAKKVLLEKEQKKDCYIYAYEIWGVKAAKIISEIYKLPLITRFQGTVLCNEKNTILNRIRRYPHYEALCTKADLIVMTDDGSFGETVLRQLGNTSRCLFVRNGLDLYEHYQELIDNRENLDLRRELNIKPETKIILMASRLVSWKRVDRGIVALKEVIKKEPDTILLIAGEGDMKNEWQKLSESLKLSDSVIFLGSILQNELYKYMLVSDIFMSLYDIGNLGNPTFEAMLMKMPIIALKNGDTESLLHDEENSLLLDPEDIDKLPQIILKLLNDDSLRDRLAERAFQDAVNNFYSWKTRMQIEENEILKLSAKGDMN